MQRRMEASHRPVGQLAAPQQRAQHLTPPRNASLQRQHVIRTRRPSRAFGTCRRQRLHLSGSTHWHARRKGRQLRLPALHKRRAPPCAPGARVQLQRARILVGAAVSATTKLASSSAASCMPSSVRAAARARRATCSSPRSSRAAVNSRSASACCPLAAAASPRCAVAAPQASPPGRCWACSGAAGRHRRLRPPRRPAFRRCSGAQQRKHVRRHSPALGASPALRTQRQRTWDAGRGEVRRCSGPCRSRWRRVGQRRQRARGKCPASAATPQAGSDSACGAASATAAAAARSGARLRAPPKKQGLCRTQGARACSHAAIAERRGLNAVSTQPPRSHLTRRKARACEFLAASRGYPSAF